MAHITKSLLAALIIAAPLACASAQVNFDDDIYFNPSKDKDKNIEAAKKLKKQQQQRQANAVILYPVEEYPAADTYEAEGSSTRSVDEYNRRGVFGKNQTPTDTVTMSAKEYEQFANTRRIERYYNPAIVAASGDEDLEQLYYAEPAEVNIYLNTPYYSYWGYPGSYWNRWYSPWYGPGWYSPWYGPSWAWGPSWSWGWGPSWGYDPWWGPAWGPIWGGGCSRPHYNPRHPGALHRPSASRPGSYRPASGVRPGRHQGTGSYRPGNNSYRRPSAPAGNYRRPAGNNSNHNTNNKYNSNTNQNRNYDSYTRPGRNNSSNDSYRHNSGSNYRQNSTGSYRSSGGTRSSGGGSRGRH